MPTFFVQLSYASSEGYEVTAGNEQEAGDTACELFRKDYPALFEVIEGDLAIMGVDEC